MNAVKIIENANYSLEHNAITLGEYDRIVKPFEDVEPVKHGHWIMCDEQYNAYECSICHDAWALEEGSPSENNMHYCQNCGAKMDENAEE